MNDGIDPSKQPDSLDGPVQWLHREASRLVAVQALTQSMDCVMFVGNVATRWGGGGGDPDITTREQSRLTAPLHAVQSPG